jgi:hypothetical protein
MRENSITPVTFSPDEREKISQALAAGEKRPSCPRCGSELEAEGPTPLRDPTVTSFRVQCKPCHRMAFITKTQE